MSLDVYLSSGYSANITHNLGPMARAAGIYKHLWRPDEIGLTRAEELIAPLTGGLIALVMEPEKFKAHNAENGWGKWEHFIRFVAEYREACVADPEATIRVCR